MGDISTESILETRKACRQFAMLYFQFCRTLVETFGEEEATSLVRKTIFNLSLDRSDRVREQVLKEGLDTSLEQFQKNNDLPFTAWKCWDQSMGGVRCPYAQQWVTYYGQYPWFKRLAPLYCDVIDTTNIENFTRKLSHRITKNLLWGDNACEREYFESEQVKNGQFTYASRE